LGARPWAGISFLTERDCRGNKSSYDFAIMIKIRAIFFGVTTVISTAVIASCGNGASSKLSSEESGYFSQFELALKASCSVGQTIQRENGTTVETGYCGADQSGQPQICTRSVPDYETVNVQVLGDVYPNIGELRERLASSLPPETMTSMHAQFTRALAAEQSADRSSSIRQMQESCRSYRDFVAAVEARPAAAETNDSVYLTFSPNVGPSVTYDSHDGWSVEQSFSLPTQYGSLTAGHRQARGVHALHIIFQGRRRVFILDRPFEFYLPRGYATRVSYDGGDMLALYVDRI
jgi:hypothetical protein